jgi:type I restriction enzyme M protein
MNMILNNDGNGNVLTFNSLEFPLMLGRKSIGELRAEYEGIPIDQITDAAARMVRDAYLGTFDFVFTNPPFGAKIPIDDTKILDQYKLGHRWTKDDEGRWSPTSQLQSRVPPEILFVERCVEWVKEGTGKVAIVLPDGILGNPDAEYIRAWILDNCQVLASVDLPVEAFLPQVGVQASLLFLRRKAREERDIERMRGTYDYSVFMAVAEVVGHDRRGNATYVRDPDGAEVVTLQVKQVLRRRADRDIVTEIAVREKELDDDLPRIGEAYRAFMKSGRT